MEDRPAPWVLDFVSDIDDKPAEAEWIWNRLASPQPAVRGELESRGFRFDATWHEVGAAELALSAARLIALAPSLEAVAVSTVQNIHLLIADPGYDISHSEPRWRTSIFVSRPDRIDQVGKLRFAENIIHETMHLHLTNREDMDPLIEAFDNLMFSPWRAESRPIQGVLHGLFVFTCIAAYFRIISGTDSIDLPGRKYIARRLREIGAEAADVNMNALVAGLTTRGASFASQWWRLATEAST
jgi:HEXXH motif-containing protein